MLGIPVVRWVTIPHRICIIIHIIYIYSIPCSSFDQVHLRETTMFDDFLRYDWCWNPRSAGHSRNKEANEWHEERWDGMEVWGWLFSRSISGATKKGDVNTNEKKKKRGFWWAQAIFVGSIGDGTQWMQRPRLFYIVTDGIMIRKGNHPQNCLNLIGKYMNINRMIYTGRFQRFFPGAWLSSNSHWIGWFSTSVNLAAGVA